MRSESRTTQATSGYNARRMGRRGWLMLLPVCALLLWAVLPLARKPSAVTVEDGRSSPDRPQQRELAPQAAPRVVREAAPPDTPGNHAWPVQEPATNSARALVQGDFAQKMQALERRNVERFAQAEAAFAEATRADARERAWASEREQQLRAALAADGAGARLRGVECRDPLCKLEIAAPAPMAEPIGRGLHFAREAGVQTASAFRGEGAARALTVYVVRDGASFESLSAQRTE